MKAIPYESPFHAVVDPLVGVYQQLFRVGSVQWLVCDRCGRRREYMTGRQARKRSKQRPMVCGRFTFGRRTCPGELTRVEVTR